jgi:hypothetical protein
MGGGAEGKGHDHPSAAVSLWLRQYAVAASLGRSRVLIRSLLVGGDSSLQAVEAVCCERLGRNKQSMKEAPSIWSKPGCPQEANHEAK